MDMWHTVIQCTVVLELSPKDTRPYPNTLPIWSLPGVYFLVFHFRDLTPFLIHLTRAFTFHYFFFYPFFCTFYSFYLSFTQSWCKWNVMRLITLIHKYHQYHINSPTSPNIIEITIIPQFQNFPTIPIIKYNYFFHTKIIKSNQINFQ